MFFIKNKITEFLKVIRRIQYEDLKKKNHTFYLKSQLMNTNNVVRVSCADLLCKENNSRLRKS